MKRPRWWLACQRQQHDVIVLGLAHRGIRYLDAVEYFCSDCSRGETRGVVPADGRPTDVAEARPPSPIDSHGGDRE